MPTPIRVLLADDHQLIRAGFRAVLEGTDDIEVVGEASNGVEAIALSRSLNPDVILMDVRMPELDGLTATRRIVSSGPTSRVVVLTSHDEDDLVFQAFQAGASGFILKSAPVSRLRAAVRLAADGEGLLEPDITRRIIAQHAAATTASRAHKRFDVLTGREAEVLREVARGLSNAEIADALHIAETTVKSHVTQILEKLSVRDRVQAVVDAYEGGFVRPTAESA